MGKIREKKSKLLHGEEWLESGEVSSLMPLIKQCQLVMSKQTISKANLVLA